MLRVTQSHQETIGHKLDVLLHELGVHTNQHHGQGIRQELLLDSHSFSDDGVDTLLVGTGVLEEGEEEAGEIGVKTFVAGDQFVGEGEAGHETAFLEPEDGGEGTGEEDSFNGGECDEAFGEG